MKQLALIAEPRHRSTDPDTSRAAAKSIEPHAGYLERLIVNFVAVAIEPATAERVAYALGCMHPNRWDEGTIRSAVSRTAKKGLIVPVGYGTTSRGRAAITYGRAS